MSENRTHDSDDDDCQLPADTMLVLQQFLREKELREKAEETGELAGDKGFEENWVCIRMHNSLHFMLLKSFSINCSN